ncbi:MAG: anti-sigma factor family protein [Thermomicrobiales bacterium]
MQPIDDGMLRAYLDGDPVLDDGARGRIAAALVEQPALAERLTTLRADARRINAAFAPFAMPEPDSAHRERAYRRLQTRLTTEHYTSFMTTIKERFAEMTTINRTARVRRFAFAGSLGAVALVLLLVFAPVGSIVSAALDQFRYQPTQFAAITVNTSQFSQMMGNGSSGTPTIPKTNGSLLGSAPTATGNKAAGSLAGQDPQKLLQELSKYVSVTLPITLGQLPGRQVQSAADAQAVVGRAVSAPTHLPSGVANTPQYYVSDHQTVDATLHLNEIRPALTAVGMGSLIPATGDSATIHLDAPAASIVSYGFNPTAQGDAAKNQKGVAVIAMGSPTIDVNGLDVPGIVSTISALPNMPPELIAELQKADLQHTLIIPVTDQQTVKNGTINGAPSTTISQNDGSMSVVLWITKDSVLHVAVGTYRASEMEQVAGSVK